MAIELITVPEAAQILKCSKLQIRRLIKAGKINRQLVSRNGKAFLIQPEAILNYLHDTRLSENPNA